MLATVNTIDKDIGANANVTYKFAAAATESGDVGGTSKFTIDPFSGDITLGIKLSLVSQLQYNLVCYVCSLKDGGLNLYNGKIHH